MRLSSDCSVDQKKSLHDGGFWRLFSVSFLRASPLRSGAKVKKEAENSSVHACSYLNAGNDSSIERLSG
jgi:hypothetical protein